MEDPMLTVEEIVKIDHERHFKNTDVTLQQARVALREILLNKNYRTARIRNTLIVMMPTEEKNTLEIHTITADPAELYLSFLLRMALALHEKENVEKVYTYIAKEKKAKRFIELFGKEFVKVVKDKDRFKMIVDVKNLYNKYSKEVRV